VSDLVRLHGIPHELLVLLPLPPDAGDERISAQGNELLHGQVEIVRHVRRDVGADLGHLHHLEAVQVLAVDVYRPFLRLEHLVDAAHEGGLAAAVRAHDADELSPLGIDGDAFQGPGAEALPGAVAER